MAVYVILDIDIHDPQRYEEYQAKVPALIEKYGGRYIVRGGAHQVVAGDWHPKRVVVFEWPNREAWAEFQNSPEYQPLKQIREESTTLRALVIVDGV